MFHGWNNGPRTYRVDWDGSNLIEIQGSNPSGVFLYPVPVSANGSVIPLHDLDGWSELAVWHADPPVLATYGYGTPGSPFTFEVGGEPGQHFVVRGEVLGSPKAEPVALARGAAVLSRWLEGLTVTGMVAAPFNVGAVAGNVPYMVPAGQDLAVRFQGWVLDPGTGASQPTNATVFTFTHPASDATAGSPAGPGGGSGAHGSIRLSAPGILGPPAEPTPDEWLWNLALTDPAVWHKLRRGPWPGTTLEELARALGFGDDDIADMLAGK